MSTPSKIFKPSSKPVHSMPKNRRTSNRFRAVQLEHFNLSPNGYSHGYNRCIKAVADLHERASGTDPGRVQRNWAWDCPRPRGTTLENRYLLPDHRSRGPE